MSIISCILNSKIGDYILIGQNTTRYLIVDKEYREGKFYPVVHNGYGDRVTLFPGKYTISKIIKCQ